MTGLLLASLLLLLVGEAWLTAGEDGMAPVVQTRSGKLRGYWLTSRAGRRFQAFSNIPYAEPPTGELRFKAPKPAKPWEGTRDASGRPPTCIQMNILGLSPRSSGVEDCLYLSVFTHNISASAPVLFHIHGGGFVGGSGAMSDPAYLMDEDIVIVNINYRLGIMGFLSLENSLAPGNQALKDQVMALGWVKENIASFGGDPNLVTLHGESAGSMSVYHLTISPLSKGLFHRAIAESGTSYDVGAVMAPGYVRGLTLRLAGMTGCRNASASGTTEEEEILRCLRDLDAGGLVSKLVDFREWQIDPDWTFRPVFEAGPDAFLTCPMESWEHADVPLLLGTTSAEGLLRTMFFLQFNMSWDWYSENFEKIAPLSLGYLKAAPKPDEVTKKIRSFYLPKENVIDNGWDKVVQMYTDSWFSIGIAEAAERHSQVSDVFFYYFDYIGESVYESFENKSLLVGAPHVGEASYLWPMSGGPGPQPAGKRKLTLSDCELALSKKMVKMWTDFMKYGTPTPSGGSFTWDTWTPARDNFLHISASGFKMEAGFAKERRDFWKGLDFRGNYKNCKK